MHDANTIEDWGMFSDNLRVEIERGPFDARSLEGLEPLGPPASGLYYLTQRAYDSPHPLTWHSKAFITAKEAHLAYIDYDVSQHIAAGSDPRLAIPHLSSIAFQYHWSQNGCAAQKALGACQTKACLDYAERTIRSIVAEADLLKDALSTLSL